MSLKPDRRKWLHQKLWKQPAPPRAFEGLEEESVSAFDAAQARFQHSQEEQRQLLESRKRHIEQEVKKLEKAQKGLKKKRKQEKKLAELSENEQVVQPSFIPHSQPALQEVVQQQPLTGEAFRKQKLFILRQKSLLGTADEFEKGQLQIMESGYDQQGHVREE